MEGNISIGPLEIWQSMGIIGKLVFLWLVVMSIHSITVMIDRLLAYRRTRRQSADFVARARGFLDAGDLDSTSKPRGNVLRATSDGFYAASDF